MGTVSHGPLNDGILEISQPYYISGKSGSLVLPAAGSPIATLQQLGRLPAEGGPLKASPIRVTQIRMRMVSTSQTGQPAIEIYKGTVGTQRTTGGNVRVPTPRKSTGYPAIVAAETNLYIASTGAISGGSFTPDGDPLDMMLMPGDASAFGSGESTWVPQDRIPITLEAGQGIEARVAVTGATGIFLISFDLLRQ